MQAFVEFSEAAGCKKEEADKDLPFTPDAKKAKPSTAGKYGSAYSTVRNLARQAMQKQTTKKAVKEEAEDTLDEDMIIEKTTDRQKLRDALDRHTQKAIEANRRGDDEAVKKHQVHMNKIKDKMTKLVRNEENEPYYKRHDADAEQERRDREEEETKAEREKNKVKEELTSNQDKQLDELSVKTTHNYMKKVKSELENGERPEKYAQRVAGIERAENSMEKKTGTAYPGLVKRTIAKLKKELD